MQTIHRSLYINSLILFGLLDTHDTPFWGHNFDVNAMQSSKASLYSYIKKFTDFYCVLPINIPLLFTEFRENNTHLNEQYCKKCIFSPNNGAHLSKSIKLRKQHKDFFEQLIFYTKYTYLSALKCKKYVQYENLVFREGI